MTTGGATGKPSSLTEAFLMLTFPENLREPLLNLVGTDGDADPSVVASLPFDFREAVSSELVLADGSTPTLFQKGRFFKFFKDLMKLFADPVAPLFHSIGRCLSFHVSYRSPDARQLA